jgi:sterol desaturase/sphingolipid hydroxylase (fatty acid hydroxylase superfamily)
VGSARESRAIGNLGEDAYQLTRALALGLALALGIGLERWRPHARLRPAWRTNFGLWALDSLVMAGVCGACGWIVAGWAVSNGLGLLPWIGGAGWLGVAIGLLGLDAVSYAWHRANHRLAFLWRFHRVHHADTSFHVTTALRFHPGELLLALPVRLAAVVALGIPPLGVLVFEIVFGVANLLVHGNFDLPRRFERPFQRALVTPALHRAHHASSWRELNTNFGTVFSLWDRLAGTFRESDAARRVVTGLPDRTGREPPSLTEALLLPFARSRQDVR